MSFCPLADRCDVENYRAAHLAERLEESERQNRELADALGRMVSEDILKIPLVGALVMAAKAAPKSHRKAIARVALGVAKSGKRRSA